MIKAYILIFCVLGALIGGAQSRHGLPFDSIYLEKPGGTTGLILKNKSAARAGGVLKNKGNGRTEFDYVVDSAWSSGDTLFLKRGPEIVRVRKGGLGPSDTSTADGVPSVAPGQWVQQQLAALPSLQEPYMVNGQLAGIDFKDANGNVYFRWLFDTTSSSTQYLEAIDYHDPAWLKSLSYSKVYGSPSFMKKFYAGYGLENVNDSTGKVDTTQIATKATLNQQINILQAAKLNVNPAISGGTYLKITYDSKGLVTGGANATTSDVSEGSNLYYTDVRARAAHGAQPAKTFYAGPLSGQANAAPAFRFLDSMDLPSVPSKLLTGLFSASPSGNTAYIRNNANDTILTVYDYRGIPRMRISQNGLMENYFNSNGEVGSFRFLPAANLPGFSFFNANGTGRTQTRMLGSTGGFDFGSVNAATGTISHLTIDNNSVATFTGRVVTPRLELIPQASMPALAAGQLAMGADGELYIGKGGANHKFITSDNTGLALIPSIRLTSGQFLQFGDANTYISGTSSGAFSFVGNGVDRLSILPTNGNVGVGVSVPTYKFQVAGNMYADDATFNNLTASRVVVSDANKKLVSGPFLGYAQSAINTTQTIALTSGALEQVVFIGGTTTSVALPTPVDQVKLWIRNTTSSSVSITANQILNDAVTMTSIPANTIILAVKDGTSWRRLL